ncbi:MAG TPA: hypothetical protein VKP08_14515, partial [Anaerolineales bacterium]|nr:hypothetical protein [Anaerolineales bacterium]
QAFAGDHRYIVDYLAEEVLKRQSETVRNFLLQTSILDRLTGSLCDAVTSQSGGGTRLDNLQRGNLFLISLDDKRHWYRYHHLFADVLRMHLLAEQPDQVPALHQRASEWYQQNGLTADAIHHALAAKDFERAADLIERALPVLRQSRQEAALLGWLQALPEEVFRHRHVLNVHYAGTLLQNGQLDGVESRLQDVELWLDSPAEIREPPVFVDEGEFQRLPSSVAMYHAALALAQGDADHSMKYARQVLELVRADDDFMRGAASSLVGLAAWANADLETAYQMFSKGMSHLQKVGFIPDVIGGSVTLADIRITQGRLREAMNLYERGLQMATRESAPILRGAADMHVGISGIYRERNDLRAATQHLLKSRELGEFNGLPKNPYRWRVAMARIQEAQGNLNEALDLLNEAGPLYVSDFSPNVHPVSALKAHIWVAQGKLSEALGWARENGSSAKDELSYVHEFEHITLARILLAQSKSGPDDEPLRAATSLLERLLKAAEEGSRTGSVIEILVLLACAHQMQGNTSDAFTALEHALTLAELEGYVRIFVDEGADMHALLRTAAAKGIMPDYTGKLLSAFEAEDQVLDVEAPHFTSPASSVLIEPLSQRELDILRLFKTELSGPEIARELVIALSTVRT